MTHRDELLALKARVEAQEREIDEAKSEIELLHAAHAHKTREAEALRRELAALRDDGGVGEPDADDEPIPRPELGRSLRFAAIGLGIAMIGSMMLSVAAARHARVQRARMLHAPPLAMASDVTPLIRHGEVVGTTGPEVLAVGDRCTVERTPVAAGRFDCRVEVRCGDQTLYGADPRTGYVRCDGREIVRDPDTTAFDGDPAMTLDLAHGYVTVEDRVGLATQQVRIRL